MQHHLPSRLLDYIREHHLFVGSQPLLVAVSGGLDSVVLCHLLREQQIRFSIAHCHFGLRGAESDRDAAFVEQLSKQLEVPFFLKHFDTANFAAEQKLSIQEAARQLRYEWFFEVLGTLGAGARVVTAHHLDDNIETVAMNFFRGTGITGLRGMLPVQGKVVRPLLFAYRSELQDYARRHGLSWVEDSSNASTAYTRNFFRHEVLPLIGQKFPQVAENLAANIQRFSEAAQLFDQAIATHRKALMEVKGGEVHIPVLKLSKAQPLHTIVFELFRPYGFTAAQTTALLQLLHSESGRYVQSATHQLVRHRRWLVLAPLQAPEKTLVLIGKEDDEVRFGEMLLTLSQTAVPGSLQTGAETAYIDAAKLSYPLVLRRWRSGDYFYPLGMPKKKKVSRLLIDLKMSRPAKERVWVLESGKKIVWVVGIRLDDRFKITPATHSVLRCRITD